VFSTRALWPCALVRIAPVVGAACVVGARAAGDFFFIHLDETGSCTKITMMKVRLSGLDKLCEHQNNTVTHNSKAFSITGSCIICYWRCGLVGAPQALKKYIYMYSYTKQGSE
jgi:hypothetical protein